MTVVLRAPGRAALLCACAVAALAVQPASAAPGHEVPEINTSSAHGFGHAAPAPITDAVGTGATADPGHRSSANPSLPSQAEAPPAALPSQLTADGGTFDVQVAAPAETSDTHGSAPPGSEPGSKAHDNRRDVDLPAQTASLPPAAAPTAAQIEQMLVTDQAAPPANQVRVEGGAIVLTSSAPARYADRSECTGKRRSAGRGRGDGQRQ